MPKTVLFVAPKNPDLRVESELDNVANSGLIVRPIRGHRATRQGLLDLLLHKDGDPIDVLWFACHHAEDGIVLEDGIISHGSITAIIRAIRPTLTIFNTCKSYALALSVWREVETDVLFTLTDIDDLEAYTTGTLFAANLSRLDDYRMAYEATRVATNLTYEFLPRLQDSRPLAENNLSLLVYAMDRRISEQNTETNYIATRSRCAYTLALFCFAFSLITMLLVIIHILI